jgi:hypothetical protein
MRVKPIRFQTIKHTEQRVGACSACGGATVRQRTFQQTLNPDFRRKDGSLMTPSDARAIVLAKAREWQPNFDHHNCPAIRAERVARRLKAGKK